MRKIIGRDPDAANEPDAEKWTPLHFAAIWGEPEAVEVLLESGADVDARNREGNTPLILAACHGEKAVVGLLLDRGARVDAKGRRGLTALHYAACNGGSNPGKLRAVKTKTGCYFIVGSPDCPPGMTLGGFEEIVEMLLDRGADVNARDDGNATPLMRAAGPGYSEIAKILIARKADVHMKDKGGRSALHYATGVWDTISESGLDGRDSEAVVELLVSAKADPNARDDKGRTPLHVARRIDLARALLDARADINAEDNAGMTSLGAATKRRDPPELLVFLRGRGGTD
jgi:ankyrin repeat protein